MGIETLDQDQRLPRLSKIHLGVKKFRNPQDKKGYPVATDYFVVPPELEPIRGNRPAELDIMFASNDIDAVLPHFYKACGQSSLAPLCRGDGVKVNSVEKWQSGGRNMTVSHLKLLNQLIKKKPPMKRRYAPGSYRGRVTHET